MTRAPKPKKSAGGTYIANGAKAKAGLNKSILESAWGRVKLFTMYKASRRNKLNRHTAARHSRSVRSVRTLTRTIASHRRCSIARAVALRKTPIPMRLSLLRSAAEMLESGEITVKHRKRAMRLRKKETLGREPVEVTRGEKQIRQDLGTTQGLHASMIVKPHEHVIGQWRVVHQPGCGLEVAEYMPDTSIVILFVKLPVGGRVKTRLARELDEELVLRLYESMVLDTIDMLKKGGFPFRICIDPPDEIEEARKWLGSRLRLHAADRRRFGRAYGTGLCPRLFRRFPQSGPHRERHTRTLCRDRA